MMKPCSLFKFCCPKDQSNDSDSEEDNANQRPRDTSDNHQSKRDTQTDTSIHEDSKQLNTKSEEKLENRGDQSGNMRFESSISESTNPPEDLSAKKEKSEFNSLNITASPSGEHSGDGEAIEHDFASTASSSFTRRPSTYRHKSYDIANNIPVMYTFPISKLSFRLTNNSIAQDYYHDINYMKPLSHFMNQRSNIVPEDRMPSASPPASTTSALRPITYESLIPIATYFDIKVPDKNDPSTSSTKRWSSYKHRRSSKNAAPKEECPPPRLPLRLKSFNGEGASTSENSVQL